MADDEAKADAIETHSQSDADLHLSREGFDNEAPGAGAAPAVAPFYTNAFGWSEQSFIDTVFARRVVFAYAFIALSVLLYLMMTISGGASGAVLVAYGAKLNSALRAGEWWRAVAPIFLHIQVPGLGPMHLLVNMYALWQLGPYVERLYGSAKFVVIWMVCGLCGVFASYLSVRPGVSPGFLGEFILKSADGPSAGASGALFGLFGLLFVFGIKYRDELPLGFRRAFGTGMLPTLAINLFIGITARHYIDNAAHLGGLVSGAAFGLLVGYQRPNVRAAGARIWSVLQFAALALIVASFFMVWRQYTKPPTDQDAVVWAETVNNGFKALANEDANGSAMRKESLRALDGLPHLDQKADALVARCRALLLTRDTLGATDSASSAAELESKRKYVKDVGQLYQDLNDWVLTDGIRYGISIHEN